ncbi:hypothetical protein Desaci_2086 [Desulfosporosinus acidiphilus SJ4]|uniref:Uncharacterized protein n=1 Tax=Desulfosporosinus acidiphilus (strain DSM 22704 / JCM 16185 / SJ4) TaxID=646529 RepID=I4D5I3_DESAJ|nr:hypothetical protein [Desulfosporosinus acidiphilus]AFM41057.1 hypothetical protein Desaci_2086 [Desulfosporosinus acidiphilus SJ4]
MKRFFGYLFYTLFVGVIMYESGRYIHDIGMHGGRTVNFPVFIFMALYPIVIGMVLAVPGLIQRIRQEGKWRIDWQMLLPIGLPTLLYNINLLLSVIFPNLFLYLYKYDWYQFMVSDTRSLDISGIVCGYVFISSWIRTPSDEEKDIS